VICLIGHDWIYVEYMWTLVELYTRNGFIVKYVFKVLHIVYKIKIYADVLDEDETMAVVLIMANRLHQQRRRRAKRRKVYWVKPWIALWSEFGLTKL